MFLQNSPRKYELLEISVFCEKRRQQHPDKIFSLFTLKLVWKKARNCKFTLIGLCGQKQKRPDILIFAIFV